MRSPSAPVPPVVADAGALAEAVAALAEAEGPVAVDVERAGGYRYSQRAYLLQLRRAGAGTWLIDPIAVPSLGTLAEVLDEPEWVLHAANQDLPSLAELGLRPSSLFDTELAGRLLNSERVGLSAMTEQHLGVALAKDHSAADWSRRPLPSAWLDYAALDVELLLELREELAALLAAAGREEWARQEFEAVRLAPPPAPKVDPWRRVRGLSTRSPRALAIAREVWLVRDATAAAQDRTPTKVLPDLSIAALATEPPGSIDDVAKVPGMRNQPAPSRRAYFDAVRRAQALTGAELPTPHLPADGAPNHRSWERVNPLAAARHDAARDILTALAEDVDLPRENLLPPRAFREMVWQLSGEADPAAAAQPSGDQVAAALLAQGARPWQVELTAEAIAAAMAEADTAGAETAEPAAVAVAVDSPAGPDAGTEPAVD